MTAIMTNNWLNHFQQDDISCICIKPQIFRMCLLKNKPTLFQSCKDIKIKLQKHLKTRTVSNLFQECEFVAPLTANLKKIIVDWA